MKKRPICMLHADRSLLYNESKMPHSAYPVLRVGLTEVSVRQILQRDPA